MPISVPEVIRPAASAACADCPGRLVCRCLGVTEDVILRAVAGGEVRCVNDIRRCTGAGDGCMGCRRRLERYFDSSSSSSPPICSVR